ncbi:MAG: GntR family transcriptional regulator [Beijerinckiaceae bacterium]|jgi:GntR family transcriptional regulator of vanillate catabolism|nr:GntR family transcriptional regulator [Beijerinckiaceae bacterium]
MDIKSTTTAADIAAHLRERILAGEFAPGARMHQVQLSEMLGISRTPIREALGQLANQGLLVYEPNRGYAVRTFSLAEIEAAFEVRARLEALACGLCARHGLEPAVLARLRACLALGDRILAKGQLEPEDLAPYRAMNVEFHETLLTRSGNAFLGDFVRQCHNVPLASDRVFVWEDHGVIARSHDDHHRILHAIEMRDAERAEALMREHVRFAGFVLMRMLSGTHAEGHRRSA